MTAADASASATAPARAAAFPALFAAWAVALAATLGAVFIGEVLGQGIAQSRAKRARDEWIEAAKAGLADETRHLERHGPTLARFRRARTTER